MGRIAFVQNISFEYLGVMYLSALLKSKGHKVEVFIVGQNEEMTIEEIALFKPDLVGFPCTTGLHIWALQFAEKIKESISTRIIFGGAHATYFPEIINEPVVDIICRGEGEYPILELANNIDAGEDITDTLSCWFKVDGEIIKNEQMTLIENLDELPFPDRELYTEKYPYLDKSQKVFIGGRGCPFDCTFCFNHAFLELYKGKGKSVRYRSVDNLLAEIEEVKKKYKLKTIYMQDDTFVLNKKWVNEFNEKYKKRFDLPFICLVRADLLNEEMIKGLSAAGCKNVFFGIETGSEDFRNALLKKQVNDEEIIYAAKLLHKYDIKFRTYNILGLPGETLEDAIKTVTLNARIRTDYPWCALFYPFPGTELAETAREKGLLDEGSEGALPSFFKESVVKSDFKRELANLQKLFFYGVKMPIILPLIKKLIRFRPNILFDLAFLASYAWCFLFSENLTIKEMASVGFRNVKTFFFGKA